MKLLLACMFGLVAFDAAATDYPTTGMLYNQQEDSSLTYNCTMQQSQRLRCEFIQTAVRKKAKPADLEKKLADARAGYPNIVNQFKDPKQCGRMSALFSVLSGQLDIDEALKRYPDLAPDAAAFRTGMARLREEAKTSPIVLDSIKAVITMCDHPSEENYLAMTRADHAKDMKTCQVSSNPYTQEFVWVADFGNSGAWVVSAQPEGPCGIVQLSRFEMDKEYHGLFWRYVARKAATNPTGTLLPGYSCSAVDQGEYLYDWKKTRSDHMQCEFVEFSPI
ncbi:hypothetical protein [Rhizobium ruizarguesonis]|uniref:hypothetical protein n=1 Tax=Rhizobium ruizarguesonis TaxID=2081791 RepID=UPI001FDFD261|nr:hypothetical protein [Rhizobium ruizarguesonis]